MLSLTTFASSNAVLALYADLFCRRRRRPMIRGHGRGRRRRRRTERHKLRQRPYKEKATAKEVFFYRPPPENCRRLLRTVRLLPAERDRGGSDVLWKKKRERRGGKKSKARKIMQCHPSHCIFRLFILSALQYSVRNLHRRKGRRSKGLFFEKNSKIHGLHIPSRGERRKSFLPFLPLFLLCRAETFF